MGRRRHKVVLIDSVGYQRTAEGLQLDCFLWSQIDKLSNIRDYDTIILDLLPLEDNEKQGEVPWDRFCAMLNFPSTMDVLLNGGMIIVVGDPRFKVRSKEMKGKNDKTAKNDDELPFLSWTGIDFVWDSEPGDTVIFQDDYDHREYSEYINKLNRWGYSLAGCSVNRETLTSRFNLNHIEKQDSDIHLRQDFFCYNRYRNGLAFALEYQYRKREYRDWRVVETFGPIVILPRISLPEDDTIQIILTEICGIETNLPEPEWLSEFVAPGQNAIDDEITRIKGELDNTFNRLQNAQDQRAERRKCLKLLYEREYALEPVVRDILRGLGAHVEDSVEKNKEDGWIVVRVGDTTREGVLEIKSTKSDTFSEEGRKQLLDWIDRGRTLRQRNYKGICGRLKKMDTDDLSSMAYDTLRIADQINHSFTTDMGAMSGQHQDEDSYLQDMLKFVRHTKRFPNDYIDEWGLETEISAQGLRKGMLQLEKHILKTLSTPAKKRGKAFE